MKRILRLRGYQAHFRFLGELQDGIAGHIPRQRSIPSPYAYSPTHAVYMHPDRGAVFIVQTSHRVYDVFAVPADLITDEETASQPAIAAI